MVLKDLMKAESYEEIGDIDMYDDYDERCACCWCGNELTEEGKEHFKDILELPVEVNAPMRSGVVHCETGHEAELVKELFMSAAGYCSEKDYDKWFKD